MTRTAAIIGGGVIGGGWAARFLLNGWNVQVFDPDPQAERKIGAVLVMSAGRIEGILSERDIVRVSEGSGSFTIVGASGTTPGGIYGQVSATVALSPSTMP